MNNNMFSLLANDSDNEDISDLTTEETMKISEELIDSKTDENVVKIIADAILEEIVKKSCQESDNPIKETIQITSDEHKTEKYEPLLNREIDLNPISNKKSAFNGSQTTNKSLFLNNDKNRNSLIRQKFSSLMNKSAGLSWPQGTGSLVSRNESNKIKSDFSETSKKYCLNTSGESSKQPDIAELGSSESFPKLFSKNDNQKQSYTYSNTHDVIQKPVKRILCKNIINTDELITIESNNSQPNKILKCAFMTTCLYAHNLEEQNVDASRKEAINILKDLAGISQQKIHNLSKIETENSPVYDLFLLYTKTCQSCVQNKCVGGYNCKFGSPLESLVVCIDDLISGDCSKLQCDKLHLSQAGFIPYTERQRQNTVTNLQSAWKKKVIVGSKEDDELPTISNADLDKFIDNMEEKADSDDEYYSSNMVVLERSFESVSNPLGFAELSAASDDQQYKNPTNNIPNILDKNVQRLSGTRENHKPMNFNDEFELVRNSRIRVNNDEDLLPNLVKTKKITTEFYKINEDEENW
jgi:hypothetical protein